MRMFFAATCLASAFVANSAAAVGLAPGQTLDTDDYFDFGEVLTADAAWYGTLLGSYSGTATETRDGLVLTDVIEDLYDVSAYIGVDVYLNSSGTLTFAFELWSQDDSGVGTSGVQKFLLGGFGGYDTEIGWTSDKFPYVPLIKRTADGDDITVEYFGPDDTWIPSEIILVRTNALAFSLSNNHRADIYIDSFGTYTTAIEGLPVPSQVPLPASGLLMLAALATVGFRRTLRRASV